MKKIFKYFLFVFCLILITMPNISVNAVDIEGDTGEGEYIEPSTCKETSTMCYSGQGLRFSLYRNTGKNKNTKVGTSFDIWDSSYYSPVNDKKHTFTEDNIKYTSLTRDNVAGKIAKQYVPASEFNIGYNQYKKYINSIGKKIIKNYGKDLANVHDEWVYDTFDDYNVINEYFGTSFTSTTDFTNYFITVEQVYEAIVREPTTLGENHGFKSGFYVGTSYELATLDATHSSDSWSNNSMLVYTTTTDGKEGFHDFLGKTGLVAVDRMLDSSNLTDKRFTHDNLATPTTVGMAVYRIVDIMPGPSNCKDYCKNSSGDGLLYCAENYCSNNERDNKTNCMSSCGISKPGFSTCSSSESCQLGTTTECSDTVSSSQVSCYPAAAQSNQIVASDKNVPLSTTYYKVECSESSRIIYNNSLPATITRGMGFSYTLSVEGKRTCVYTFEIDRWRYDYTMGSDNVKKTLEGYLKNFQNGSLNNEFAKYDVENIDIEIDISENIGGVNKITTQSMEITNIPVTTPSKTKNKETLDIKTYVNGVEKWFSVPTSYSTESTAVVSYHLPGVCIKTGTGEIYEATNNSCSGGLSPYYKYFTSNYSSTGKNAVTIRVKKTDSCLNDTNSCYYNVASQQTASCVIVDAGNNIYNLQTTISGINKYNYGISLNKDEVNNQTSIIVEPSARDNQIIYGTIANDDNSVIYATCSLEVEAQPTGEASCEVRATDYDGRVELYIDTDLRNYTYGLSTISGDINNLDVYEAPLNRLNDITVYGTVKNSKGEIVATCEGTINGNGESDPPNTCKLLYSSEDYTSIRSYCSSSWNIDTEKYASEQECYVDCTDTDSVCKTVISDRTNPIEVRRYCDSNYTQDGYVSLNACIADCFDPNGGLNYIYRPISLKDPFPNDRDAGLNWFGKEHYITDDANNPALEESATPEYVIKLSSKAMKEIRNQTNSYNNSGNKRDAYVDYIRSETITEDNKYYSKFINDDDVANGGFSRLFTVIRSEEVN